MVETLLFRFNGISLRKPQQPYPAPDKDFLYWHREEVFKHPARTRQDMKQAFSRVAEAPEEFNNEKRP